MNRYIDSEKLIDMIDNSIAYCQINYNDDYALGFEQSLREVKNFITSLQQEQSDVDLEKEIDLSIRQLYGVHSLEENNERWYKGRYENIKELVLQYYELGLNARKN